MSNASFKLLDDSDVAYDLLTYLIDFGRMARGLVVKRRVRLLNVGFTAQNVELQCVPHPTAQVGLPQDTYQVAALSTSEDGTYVPVLTLPTLLPNSKTDIWIRLSLIHI